MAARLAAFDAYAAAVRRCNRLHSEAVLLFPTLYQYESIIDIIGKNCGAPESAAHGQSGAISHQSLPQELARQLRRCTLSRQLQRRADQGLAELFQASTC